MYKRKGPYRPRYGARTAETATRRHCTICDEWKPFADFTVAHYRPDGSEQRQSHCKACTITYIKQIKRRQSRQRWNDRRATADYLIRRLQAHHARGVTHRALAKVIGVHPNTITKWVMGETRPSMTRFSAYAERLWKFEAQHGIQTGGAAD